MDLPTLLFILQLMLEIVYPFNKAVKLSVINI